MSYEGHVAGKIMPEQELGKFGKCSLKFSPSVGAGANFMSRMHRKFFITLWLLAAALLTSASAQETRKPEPLVIREQGSFAVGGTQFGEETRNAF